MAQLLLLCIMKRFWLWLVITVAVAAAEPEIWFAPDDQIHQVHRSDPRPNDFMDLFAAGAPWSQAAAHIQVFQIYPQFADRVTDAELGTVIEGLRRRKIALALSCGMLNPPPGGAWHEGYGAAAVPKALARIKRLGGEVRWAIADEPLYFGHFYRGPGVVPVSIKDMAKELAATACAGREIFPNLRIGMEEPIMAYASQAQWLDAMRELLAEFRQAFGEPMGCVRLENANYSIREWLPRFVAAAKFLDQQHIPFGILVTGDTDDTSDAEWFRKAEERYVAYESEGRSFPAQMVFQSWMPRPARLLPETEPLTHTHFLNEYFRDRTILTATRSEGRLTGRLSNAAGQPIAGAHVALVILPGFNDADMRHRLIKGTVPSGAKSAGVGVRIGIEGSCGGTARFRLGAVRYTETTDSAHAATVRFNPGLKGWGRYGSATTTTDSTDQVLNVTATPEQTLMLNSKIIPVTAGREFAVELDLQLEPDTETGYFVVFFFDEAKKVLMRVKEPLVSDKPRFLKELTTDSDGQFSTVADLPALQQAREIQLTYAGDSQHRSALHIIPSTPDTAASSGAIRTIETEPR